MDFTLSISALSPVFAPKPPSHTEPGTAPWTWLFSERASGSPVHTTLLPVGISTLAFRRFGDLTFFYVHLNDTVSAVQIPNYSKVEVYFSTNRLPVWLAICSSNLWSSAVYASIRAWHTMRFLTARKTWSFFVLRESSFHIPSCMRISRSIFSRMLQS